MYRCTQRSVGSGFATIGLPENTKGFLQKICYKIPASVDMTRYGFICDSKVAPVNLLLKPLREKLVKICGQSQDSAKPTQRRTKARKSSPPTPAVVDKGARKNHKEPAGRVSARRRKCPKTKQKVPNAPQPSQSSIFKKCELITPLTQNTRKSRVTFEEPHVTEMKKNQQFNQSFRKW